MREFKELQPTHHFGDITVTKTCSIFLIVEFLSCFWSQEIPYLICSLQFINFSEFVKFIEPFSL